MANIKCTIIILGLFFLFTGCNNAQNKINSNDLLYGKWKYVKHFGWRATKFGNKEIQSIINDTLIIEHDKIYFVKSKFIEPCNYSNILLKKFFDRDDKEPNVMEDRALAMKYTKEQLSTLNRVEINCSTYNCLNTLYLKQDTLILNYCGGITIFLLKVKH